MHGGGSEEKAAGLFGSRRQAIAVRVQRAICAQRPDVLAAFQRRRPQGQAGDVTAGRGGVRGQRGTDAQAEEADLAHAGLRAQLLDRRVDAHQPGLQPVGILVGTERVSGAIVVEPQDGKACSTQRVGERAIRTVGDEALPAERIHSTTPQERGAPAGAW